MGKVVPPLFPLLLYLIKCCIFSLQNIYNINNQPRYEHLMKMCFKWAKVERQPNHHLPRRPNLQVTIPNNFNL